MKKIKIIIFPLIFIIGVLGLLFIVFSKPLPVEYSSLGSKIPKKCVGIEIFDRCLGNMENLVLDKDASK